MTQSITARDLAIDQEVKSLTPEIIRLRRDFHQHPELGFQETRTAGVIARRLETLGLEVREGVGCTGVVGLLRGSRPGKTIMLRADMDALPIQEDDQTPYASTNSGVAHACGHDAHSAMVLIAAELLSKHRDGLSGNIKFVFQPAEEGPGGAEPMIRDGVLDNPTVDAAIGLHVWNDLPVGKVGVRAGPLMASCDVVEISILGRSGHGAVPHQCADPVAAAAQVISALQTIVSREISPTKPAVVTIASIHGGAAPNIIPDEVRMTGTTRAFDKTVRESLPGRIERIVKGVTSAMQCSYKLNYIFRYPPTINDEVITELVRQVASSSVGQRNVVLPEQTTGGEDMSFFLERVPGCYFFLGSANSKKGLNKPHHNSKFDLDEACLPVGVQILAQSALTYLSQA